VILHVTILALVFAIGLVSVAALLRRPRVIRSAFLGAGVCWFVTELFVFPLTSYPIESMLEHRIPSFYFLGEYYNCGTWPGIVAVFSGTLLGAALEVVRGRQLGSADCWPQKT
jgi:hypothetical protein